MSAPEEKLHEDFLQNVRFVPRKIAHHGAYSGYDLIFDRLGLKPAQSNAARYIARHIPEFINWRLRAMRPQESGRVGMEAEVGALPWVMGGGGRICHFIYGEDTFFYTPLWKRKKNKVIASFHYPPQRLSERTSPGALRNLDAAIVVGTNQIEYLAKFIDPDRIFFIPHHVDTDFFKPNTEKGPHTENVTAIFVGNCLRDFDTLEWLIQQCEAKGISLKFNLVIPGEKHSVFNRYLSVKCYSGVSDFDLLHLYQTADFGVMPMLDCTANNSVLEMMAVGLSVIATDVGGVRDYLPKDGCELVTNRTEMLAAVENAASCMTPGHRHNGGIIRAKTLEKFSVPKVKRLYHKAYQALL